MLSLHILLWENFTPAAAGLVKIIVAGWLAAIKHHGYFGYELLASIIIATSRRGLFWK